MSICCTADVCLHQSVNQLHNNQNMAKLVLFSTARRKDTTLNIRKWGMSPSSVNLAAISASALITGPAPPRKDNLRGDKATEASEHDAVWNTGWGSEMESFCMLVGEHHCELSETCSFYKDSIFGSEQPVKLIFTPSSGHQISHLSSFEKKTFPTHGT